VGYGDVHRDQYSQTFCHNALTFGQRMQLGGSNHYETAIVRFLTTSGARCPGREGGIDWVAADLTAVYPQAASVVRHLVFMRPGIVIVCDEVEAKRPELVEQNFTCLGPLSQESAALFVSTATKNRLQMCTEASTALTHEIKDWGTHWRHIPSYRLIRGTAARARRCTFVTALVPHPLSVAAPTIESLDLAGAIGIRIRTGDAEDLFVCGLGKRSLAEAGLGTDARMMALRSVSGRPIGAAILDGSRLSLEGQGELIQRQRTALVGAVVMNDAWQIVDER